MAHKLLNHVTAEMTKIGMHRFCGETRASNRAMQRVFEDCGYLLNVIEEEYYDNPYLIICARYFLKFSPENEKKGWLR